MEEHVIAALQKGGVHRKHRRHPLLGHAGRHGRRVALGDAHVKEPLREALGKAVQARAPLHGRRDGADFGILLRQLAQGLPEHSGEVRGGRVYRLPGLHAEAAHPVEEIRVALRRRIAFPLYSSDVEQDRPLQLPGIAEQLGQALHIVAVHRPQIGKAHVLEQAAGQKGLLDGRLDLVGHVVDVPAQGEDAHHLSVALFEMEILGLEPLAGQMLRHTAHAPGDGHAVVVEDDDQRLPAVAGIRQALIGQAAGERPVPNQGQHLIIFIL